MKKIVVQLNTKSVEEAIKQVRAYKQAIPRMMNELLEFACEWLIEKANSHIDLADIGDDVKLLLRNGWEYEVFNGSAKVTNSINVKKTIRQQEEEIPLSVLVEFGVGAVGESNQHPNASDSGYEYNVPSPSKYAGRHHDEDTWRFITNSPQEIDLPQGSYETWRMGSGAFKIITRGAKGVMFAYNAIVDANMDLRNPNGEFAREWKRIKERYLR